MNKIKSDLRFAFGVAGICVMVSTLFAFTFASFIENLDADTPVVHEVETWIMPDMSVSLVRKEQVCDMAPVRIIDGDTFQAVTTTTISPTLKVTEITSFRLLWVDTPERKEEGYQEAKDYLRKRIGGKLIRVRLKQGPGKKRDSFGRFLVDIFLCTKGKLVFINDEIIEKKLGKRYSR